MVDTSNPCISFIIGPTGLGYDESLQEIMWLEAFGGSDFT